MTARRSADARGREVVGLYGDPDTTWGIGVEAGLRRPLPAAEADQGLLGLAQRHPHLGTPAPVLVVPADEWETTRAATLAHAYLPGEPLVRAALSGPDAEGTSRLLVAAHHGVCDGLGLLALVTAASGVPVTPTAPGVGDRSAPRSFLRSAPGRLAEAFRRPPPRLPALFAPEGSGEEVVVRTVPRARLGTVAVCLDLARLYAARAARGRTLAQPLVVVGASRRPPGTVAPDRQTAYLRFRVDPHWTLAEATSAFAALAPEPDFPETSLGGIGPRLVRPFRGRLGSTAVVSNLGVLEGDIAWLAMYPALSGPHAVSVGVATTAGTTTLSVRTRSQELGRQDAERILEELGDALLPPGG